MITPGGEVAFVKKIIQESLDLREAVRWYTSMLGKRSSLLSLIDELQSLDNKNWAVTEFIQGDKTKRWAIAWSWKDIRPTMVGGGYGSAERKAAMLTGHHAAGRFQERIQHTQKIPTVPIRVPIHLAV